MRKRISCVDLEESWTFFEVQHVLVLVVLAPADVQLTLVEHSSRSVIPDVDSEVNFAHLTCHIEDTIFDANVASLYPISCKLFS